MEDQRVSYTIFDQKKTRIGRPAVTINPAGRIYFNQEAAGWLAAHRVKRILLMWHSDALMIGIRAGRNNDARAYSLAYSDRGGGASVTAKSFLNWIGFSSDRPVTTEAELNDEKTLIEFEVPEECIEEE